MLNLPQSQVSSFKITQTKQSELPFLRISFFFTRTHRPIPRIIYFCVHFVFSSTIILQPLSNKLHSNFFIFPFSHRQPTCNVFLINFVMLLKWQSIISTFSQLWRYLYYEIENLKQPFTLQAIVEIFGGMVLKTGNCYLRQNILFSKYFSQNGENSTGK